MGLGESTDTDAQWWGLGTRRQLGDGCWLFTAHVAEGKGGGMIRFCRDLAARTCGKRYTQYPLRIEGVSPRKKYSWTKKIVFSENCPRTKQKRHRFEKYKLLIDAIFFSNQIVHCWKKSFENDIFLDEHFVL